MAEWFGNMWSNIMEGLFGGNETDIKPVEPIPIPEPFPSESEEEGSQKSVLQYGGVGAFLRESWDASIDKYTRIDEEAVLENSDTESGDEEVINPYSRFTMDDYEKLLCFAGECLNSYEGFVAVSYVVLNNAIYKNADISDNEVTSRFTGYDLDTDIEALPDDIKRAARDVLTGAVDNPIGDACFFFGRKTGYDLWVDSNKASFVKVIGGNVFYVEWGSVHNKWPLTDEEKEADNVIIIYDAERNEWLHQGDIIVDGKVVVNSESE